MKKLISWFPVKIIAWKHKGIISTIKRVDNDLVYLDGINVYKKAKKWQWYIDVVLPIHISNVMYYDSTTSNMSKIWFSVNTDWQKKRIIKKTGKSI